MKSKQLFLVTLVLYINRHKNFFLYTADFNSKHKFDKIQSFFLSADYVFEANFFIFIKSTDFL